MDDSPLALEPEKLLSHADFLRSLAQRLLEDEHQAEDVAQETWLAAVKKPPGQGVALRAWLAGTARNLARRVIRKESRRRTHEKEAASEEALRPTHEIVEREQTRRKVVKAVLKVKEPYRSAVLFRFYDDLPPREIARRFNLPVETVKTRIQRGLAQLKIELDAAYGNERKAWCVALLPLAGLKSAATAGSAGATVFMGALAMTLKTKILLAVASLLVLATAFLVWQLAVQEEAEDAFDLAGFESSLNDGLAAVPPAAEAVQERLLLEAGPDMPLAYQEALGGIRGRILEASGLPLARETVELFSVKVEDFLPGRDELLGESPPFFEVKTSEGSTDEAGRFRFTGIYPRGLYGLGIHRDGKRATLRFIDGQPDPGAVLDVGDIILEGRTRLTGRVVDDNGRPVAGALVRAARLPGEVLDTDVLAFRPGCSFLLDWGIFETRKYVIDPPPALCRLLEILPFPMTRSGRDGSFTLDDVPFGEVRVLAQKEGYLSFTGKEVEAREGEETAVALLCLTRSMPFTGQVVDAAGKGIAGVEVRLGKALRERAMTLLTLPVFTDEQGHFQGNAVPATAACCAIRRFAEESWTFVGPFDPGDPNLTFTLPSGLSLRITMKDEAGRAVKNGRIRIRERTFQNLLPSHLPRTLEAQTSSAKKGEYLIPDLAPGEYELVLSAPGHATLCSVVTLEDRDHEIEAMLPPPCRLEVRILAGEARAPLAWVDLYLTPRGEKYLESSFTRSRGRTDDAGLARLIDMAPGEYDLHASHPGFALASGEVTLPSDEEQVLHLRPGSVLEGQVTFADSLHTPPYALLMEYRGKKSLAGMMPRIHLTDETGAFRVENLNPGKWDLEVVDRIIDRPVELWLAEPDMDTLARKTVKVEAEGVTWVELSLEAVLLYPKGSVSGKVFFDGDPAEGTQVKLHIKKVSRTATVDAWGNYDLGEIPAGEGRLRLTASGPQGHRDFTLTREIRVARDLPHVEDFHIATGAIIGKVFSHGDGKPMPGVQVKAWVAGDDRKARAAFIRSIMSGEPDLDAMATYSPVEMRTYTGLDGAFRFERVPAGIYCLKVEEQDMGCQPALDVEVLPGGTPDPVHLEVCTPVTVRGTLQVPEGLGACHLLLMVAPAQGGKTNLSEHMASLIFSLDVGGSRWADVDPGTGAFELPRMMPGAYRASLLALPRPLNKAVDLPSFKAMEFEVQGQGPTQLILVPEIDREQEPLDLNKVLDMIR